MSQRYVLSPDAASDRDEIFAYLADQKDLDAALHIDQEFERAFDLLVGNPYAGHTRTDLYLPETVRVWPVYSWLVIYRPDESPLRILRIWHGAQEKPDISDS